MMLPRWGFDYRTCDPDMQHCVPMTEKQADQFSWDQEWVPAFRSVPMLIFVCLIAVWLFNARRHRGRP